MLVTSFISVYVEFPRSKYYYLNKLLEGITVQKVRKKWYDK